MPKLWGDALTKWLASVQLGSRCWAGRHMTVESWTTQKASFHFREWIEGKRILVPYGNAAHTTPNIGYWKYPAGGKPSLTFKAPAGKAAFRAVARLSGPFPRVVYQVGRPSVLSNRRSTSWSNEQRQMKNLNPGRYALSSCMAAALLAGCGGSQLPNGAPDVMPQTSRMAPETDRRNLTTRSSYKVLYRFRGGREGEHPLAGLINVHGTLYGTTAETVYSVGMDGSEKVLHRFGRGTDGRGPRAGLINVNGTLYGTTAAGGSFNNGTVYSISPTGSEKVIYSFSGDADGWKPQAPLIVVRGTLYGTTEDGGSLDDGTVFSVTSTGSEKVLHNFACCSDGTYPSGGLVDVNGTLYGTTFLGGGLGCGYRAGCGTIYRISTNGSEKVLHRFKGSVGANPFAGLIKVNGMLYGTTSTGGRFGDGTFYRMSPSGGFKVLYSFGRHKLDGSSPSANLINVKGTLYGTTWGGGSECGTFGCGTIFSLTTTGSEKILYSFAGGSDGAGPSAPLISLNGALYGTTYYGGDSRCQYGCGTVFAFTP